MSGGAFDYLYCRIDDLVGRMGDREIDALTKDFAELVRSREWLLSGDTDDEDWENDLRAFKSKWLAGSKATAARHAKLIEEAVGELKKDLLSMIGVKNDQS